MARLGVPVGGRVRKSRAVEDQSASIPEEITSELGRSMRGRARQSSVLVQRAVSEDPSWTRAGGDNLASPQRRRWNMRSEGQSGDSFGRDADQIPMPETKSSLAVEYTRYNR